MSRIMIPLCAYVRGSFEPVSMYLMAIRSSRGAIKQFYTKGRQVGISAGVAGLLPPRNAAVRIAAR